MFLLNFLGVVLILLGIYLFIAEKRNKSLEEDEEGLPTFGFTNVIQGGQSSNGSTGLLETLIGANLAAEMVNKNEK